MRSRHLVRLLLAAAGPSIALSSAASAGCSKTVELTLTDTEGRKFSGKCEPDGTCELKQTGGPQAPAGKPAVALTTTGWLVGICNVAADGSAPEAADCRPLECKGDPECPPHHGNQAGDCMNGFCADPAKAVNSDDAVMLCLAGTGLGRGKPDQIDIYAMALNCGSPCKVPATCRQP